MKEKMCISSTRIKTGLDIAYVAEMNQLLEDPTEVVLTEDEWRSMSHLPDKLLRLAGRFACKEAVMKVLGRGVDEIEFTDIEIVHDSFGKPQVTLTGAALHYWKQHGFKQMDVSISHHKDYAVAVAVAMIE